ncbi:MAG: hypothetical protein IPK19_12445 [Chloroflexi bacterium]|nr:hypothetical protein [Chloroflexota bacterium]
MTHTEIGLRRIAVMSNSHGQVATLRVGAGDFRIGDIVDGGNARRQGLTVTLWFSVRDRPELDRQLRAYPGAVINLGGYRVEVDEVSEDSDGSYWAFLTVMLP